MDNFTYARGQWIDGSDVPEWKGEEEFDNFLERVGFSAAKISFGSDFDNPIDIHESKDGRSFYASISPLGTSCYGVFLPDLPSLMMFLRDFGAVVSLIDLQDKIELIRRVSEKLFRAYHGHDPSAVCNKCDPYEFEQAMKARRERSQRGLEKMKEILAEGK